MKPIAISRYFSWLIATGALFVSFAGPAAAQQKPFQIEEATIADVQRAIQSGETTCKGVVQAYVNRAKAYNGT